MRDELLLGHKRLGLGLTVLGLLSGCGEELDVDGPLPVPPWLVDADASGSSDTSGNTADSETADASADNSDSGPARSDEPEYYAFWAVHRRETQDPSPFGSSWAESRTTTIGLIQLSWNGNVGTRLQQPCDMVANEAHGSRVYYSANFVARIPVLPVAVERTADGLSITDAIERVGLLPDWDGAMPKKGASSAPGVFDSDADGKPGVTIDLDVSLLGAQKLYVAQRSKTSLVASWQDDGSLYAEPTVQAEQSTVGATLDLLVANPVERLPSGKPANTMRWVSVPAAMNCDEVVKQAKALFGQSWPPD